MHECVNGRAAVALALLLACALDQRAGRLRCHGMGFVKQASGLHFIALGRGGLGLFAQVVRLPLAEVALARRLDLGCDGGRLGPIARTLVDG